jgi:hypothetical protein
MKRILKTMTSVAVMTCAQLALAGPIDPECTAEKAAKGTAAKATVGVGGRCTPAEAAKDQTKNAVGIDDKKGKDKKKDKDQGPIEQRRDDDPKADAAKGVAKKAVN